MAERGRGKKIPLATRIGILKCLGYPPTKFQPNGRPCYVSYREIAKRYDMDRVTVWVVVRDMLSRYSDRLIRFEKERDEDEESDSGGDYYGGSEYGV